MFGKGDPILLFNGASDVMDGSQSDVAMARFIEMAYKQKHTDE